MKHLFAAIFVLLINYTFGQGESTAPLTSNPDIYKAVKQKKRD